MRVLLVCADPGVGLWGRKGASVHLLEVTRALRAEGHDVVLAARRVDGPAPADLADAAVRLLPSIGRGHPAERERRAQAVDVATAQVVADVAPDLVWERYALWSHRGLAAAQRLGIPSVIEVNAPLVTEQARHRDLVDVEGALAATRRALRAADVAIAVSEPVARWATGHRRDAVDVVPNGVDPTRFTPADVGRGPHLDVVFVGTLKPWHGVEVLLAAMALLEGGDDSRSHAAGVGRSALPVRLRIVGEGPMRDALQDRAAALGLNDRVTFVGGVDPADVPTHLAAADVAVAPYPAGADYFSPLKLLEYQAAGLAVVASDIGQVPLLATHDRDAVLVPPGDVGALAAALAGLARDPAAARRLGMQGRRRVVATRTWRHVVTTTLDLVCRATDDPSARAPDARDPATLHRVSLRDGAAA